MYKTFANQYKLQFCCNEYESYFQFNGLNLTLLNIKYGIANIPSSHPRNRMNCAICNSRSLFEEEASATSSSV